jgi:hypothetical protein
VRRPWLAAPEDTAATRARRFRNLVSGMGTWRWRTTTALPAAQVERIIADWAQSAVTSRRTGIPPVRRHRDGALYVRRPGWRWGDHFRLTVQPEPTGAAIHVEQRFYPPAVVSNGSSLSSSSDSVADLCARWMASASSSVALKRPCVRRFMSLLSRS